MPRIKLREYRSTVHKPPQKCTQLNGSACGVRVCHHHQTGLLCATCVSVVHKNMSYDGVQVYIRNNASVCTYNCIKVCEPA